MNDLTRPPGLDLPADPGRCGADGAANLAGACKHDCDTCLDVFGATQNQVEQLRANLWREEEENYRLWLQLRAALAQTLDNLAPGPRAAGPAHSEEFARGWNQCVREIDRRVRELQKVF